MKYLIMESFSGQAVPFIFPRSVDHADMRDQLPYKNVISCGYIEMKEGELTCYGTCAELDKQSLPEDVRIIYEALHEHKRD